MLAGTYREGVKLENGGVRTMAALAALKDGESIAKLAPETLAKLRRQARLQVEGRTRQRLLHEILEARPERGFSRLPTPNAGWAGA